MKKQKESGKLYEEAVEALHSDLEMLEQENEKYKVMLKKLEKNGSRVLASPAHKITSMEMEMNDDPSPRGSPMNASRTLIADRTYEEGTSEVVSKAYLTELEHRVQQLRMLVKSLKNQNIRLTQKKMLVSAALLSEENDPLIKYFGKTPEAQAVVEETMKPSKEKELMKVLSKPLLVDLSQARSKLAPPGWKSRLNEPEYQFRLRRAELKSYLKREDQLVCVN